MLDHSASFINRRQVLQGIAISTLGALLPVTTFATEEKSAAVSFGFSLYGMKSVATTDAFRILNRIGYDAVELVCMPDWSTAPESLSREERTQIKQELERLNLQLPALMENLPLLVSAEQRQKHLDRIKAAGELGHDLSPEKPPVLETIMGGKPDDWPAVKNEMVEELGRWADAAEACQTVLAVKPHVSGAVHAPDSADWLIQQVNSPWIRLAYDYSHYQIRDYDFEKSLDRLLPHSVFIHVKDNLGTDGKVQFALPGEGNIDYPTYFKALKKHHYRGTVMVEVSSQLWRKDGYDPVAAAKTSFANLKPILRSAGLA
ncbi:MAG: sugar phosphate isomerase/epimerase [Planctomycetaceae bacterium]|nr:sugar phosphate isomerase/epimerase [Planctomycetaceae bacterium]